MDFMEELRKENEKKARLKKESGWDDYTVRFKPFDYVKTKKGSIGIVQEVNYNTSQEPPIVSYSVDWIDRKESNIKYAWWKNWELDDVGKNMFEMMAKMVCHPFGHNEEQYPKIFGFEKM